MTHGKRISCLTKILRINRKIRPRPGASLPAISKLFSVCFGACQRRFVLFTCYRLCRWDINAQVASDRGNVSCISESQFVTRFFFLWCDEKKACVAFLYVPTGLAKLGSFASSVSQTHFVCPQWNNKANFSSLFSASAQQTRNASSRCA